MEKTKMLYALPECEVLELRLEGVIAASGEGFEWEKEEE